MLRCLTPALKEETSWEEQALWDRVKRFAEKAGVKLGMVAGPLRAALTGSHISPSVFEVMAVLGKEQSLARIEEQAH